MAIKRCKLPIPTNRPGGFLITDRALNFCNFPAKAKILDLGCGTGATVEHVINNYGFNISGLDKNLAKVGNQKKLIVASANNIPYADAKLDGVLMECSLSMMENPVAVLKECHRILKMDGRLIISDVYAQGEPARLKGCLNRVDTKNDILEMLFQNGFKQELFEDYSPYLKATWGQMIFEKGACEFYCSLGVDIDTMKRIKCGYYLIIARKKDIL